jgi:hypothetical protein
VCVFCSLFVFLSPLVWFFLWLPEEVLTLLFLLHRENGDFSILMKDILSSLLLQFAYFEGYRGSVQLDFSFCDLFTEHLGETRLSRVITIVASNGKLKSCLNLDYDCCALSCIKAGEGLGVHIGFLHLHENLYIS